MPEKTKNYERVIFTPEVIKEAERTLLETLAEKERELTNQRLLIQLTAQEKWDYDNEEEFFADYIKGFEHAHFDKSFIHGNASIEFWIFGDHTQAAVAMKKRADIEKIFNILESNMEKCRLPRQPQRKSKIKTDWITETINKIEGRCAIAGRKLELALTKLDSEEAEEWQNAAMLIRDAWIELTQWLCRVNNIDTSDIPPDAVIDRLKKLKIDKTDDRLFNLARASFNLSAKHHKRDIDQDTATACVVSTIVSMQTVIREVFNATG